jgi:hypothetical protein
VIGDRGELQGAYDLVEGGRVSARALVASFAQATLDRARGEPWVFAVIDGSSVQLTDLTGRKGLGSIGALTHGARGMKVINALAVDSRGVTLGLLGQVWWARTNARPDSRDKRARNAARPLADKETKHWIDAIEQAQKAADGRKLRLWFQVDREADNCDLLLALHRTGHDFTVRAAWDRLLEATGEDEQKLRQHLARRADVGHYDVPVTGAPRRSPRVARMVVRTAVVTLAMRRRGNSAITPLTVNAVWALEEGSTPAGEKPLDWLLLTSRSVKTFTTAFEVIDGYTKRWRIEEFHRAWKTSVCRVEDMQLRSAHAVTTWATMLAAVAARAERLRLLARKQPDQPATVELSDVEIQALILLRRHRRRGRIPETPTIAEATLWIAELGGYTGKSSGGPPGAITIGRGLEHLVGAAEMLSIVRESRE